MINCLSLTAHSSSPNYHRVQRSAQSGCLAANYKTPRLAPLSPTPTCAPLYASVYSFPLPFDITCPTQKTFLLSLLITHCAKGLPPTADVLHLHPLHQSSSSSLPFSNLFAIITRVSLLLIARIFLDMSSLFFCAQTWLTQVPAEPALSPLDVFHSALIKSCLL